MKKYNYFYLVIVIVLCAGVIIFKEYPNNTYFTMDYEMYADCRSNLLKDDQFHSGLYIFPQDICPDTEDINFMYVCEKQKWKNNYEIILRVKYTEDEYKKEVKRLSGLNCEIMGSDGITTNKIMYTEDAYDYPAYVAIQGCDESYEYALTIDEEKEIVYVFFKGFEFFSLPSQYIPQKYKNGDYVIDNSWDNFNMYYFTEKNGDHTYYKD